MRLAYGHRHAHRKVYGRYVQLVGFVIVGALLAIGSWTNLPNLVQGDAHASSGCQLAQIAFCETFAAPANNSAGTRSGDLDATLWGVSHTTSYDNPSQGIRYGWNQSHLDRCGSTQLVAPPHDVQICNGQVFESLADGGAVAALAMYPRQPFDFAGRTGHIVFDVSNDTQGSHMAWPEIVISDQPVPAPFERAAGVLNFARNSVGVDLGSDCLNGQLVVNGTGDSWAVSEMWTSSSYAFNQQSFTMLGCVKKSPGPGSAMNHVELRITPSHLEVWASDPGSSTIKQIASANFTMPLTRGLVWMEDAHYNACKEPGTQCDHTFAWSNFGFDGPLLPRDLAFDVPDADTNFNGGGNLGFLVPANATLNLQIQNVHGLANAAAALLTFEWYSREANSISVSLNGHAAHTTAWPYGNAGGWGSQTLGVSIPLSEVVNGTNSLAISSSATSYGGLSVASIDLILVAAGGMPNGGPSPTSTPTSTATATPTLDPSTATPTSTPTAAVGPPTDTPTPLPPTNTPTALPTNTPTTRPTNTATPRPTNTPTATPTSTATSVVPPLPTVLPTLPTIRQPVLPAGGRQP